ncbi:MAG: glycosyltransferase family 4 protein [Thermoanaerobaculaceae bacterium]
MYWAFDARAAFVDPYRGFGRVVQELVPALLRRAGPSVLPCVPRNSHLPPQWYPQPEKLLKLRRPRRGAWLFDGPAWAWTARRYHFSCLHLPAWGVPPGIPVPVVATFHDATALLYPQALSWWQRIRSARAIASLRRATVIHAVSRFAARQLADLFPFLGTKIVVIPHGVSPRFCPQPGSRGAFVLGVGGGETHKNWDVILRAYSDPQASKLPPLRLVGQLARHPRILQQIQDRGLAARVQLFANVSEEFLIACYNQALALVFPSRSEGFGLPALEAMACGCPVLAANTGALPEVCGQAALLLSPDDPMAWLAALLALANRGDLQKTLSQKGLQHVQAYTWDAAAASLVEVYRELTR